MIGTPGDKSPVSPMPETAEEEDNKRVANNLCLGAAATAEWDIHIIPEPSGQRNVPTSPKLRDVAAEIRDIEVPHQLDSKEFGCSDGDVGITREITVDLESEEDGGKQQGTTALRLIGIENLVHINGAVIRNNHLFEQSPKNLPQTINPIFILKRARPPELRQQVRRSFNRAGDELRKETDEGEKLDDIAGRFQLSTIDIYGIAERLEGVETDADGEDYLEQQSFRLSAEEHVRKGCDEEIIILENAQNKQVEDNVDDIDRLGFSGRLAVFVNEKTCKETAGRSECDQEKKPPVPPAIKDVGYHYNKEILQLEVLLEDEPIEQKHYRQENGELYGVEKHLG